VLEPNAAGEFKTATDPISATLPIGGFYCYGEIAPAAATGASACHNSTLVTLLLGEEPGTAIGPCNPHRRFFADHLAQEIQALTQALTDSQAQVQDLQRKLTECQALGRIATHSKTEQSAHHRTLALGLVCGVLDRRYDAFRRLAMKGEPPRLNKTDLARLVNELHQQLHGSPFPLSLPQLAYLLELKNG
jgi:hypothetical protein